MWHRGIDRHCPLFSELQGTSELMFCTFCFIPELLPTLFVRIFQSEHGFWVYFHSLSHPRLRRTIDSTFAFFPQDENLFYSHEPSGLCRALLSKAWIWSCRLLSPSPAHAGSTQPSLTAPADPRLFAKGLFIQNGHYSWSNFPIIHRILLTPPDAAQSWQLLLLSSVQKMIPSPQIHPWRALTLWTSQGLCWDSPAQGVSPALCSPVPLKISGFLLQVLPGPHILGFPGSARGPAPAAETLGAGNPRNVGEKISTLLMEAKTPIPGAPRHSLPTTFLAIKPNVAAGLKHFSGSGYFSCFYISILRFISRFVPKHNYHAANEISNIFSFQEISLS